MAITNSCPYCGKVMRTARMACSGCHIAVEGQFPESRLANLPTEHQRFIELFVLAGGSLKQIAEQAGVSYPTIRSRLDKVIEALLAEMTPPGQAKPKDTTLSSEEAARLIKSI
ncbi:MAG: DUF2089 family protein [Pirellulales bacterium]